MADASESHALRYLQLVLGAATHPDKEVRGRLWTSLDGCAHLYADSALAATASLAAQTLLAREVIGSCFKGKAGPEASPSLSEGFSTRQ